MINARGFVRLAVLSVGLGIGAAAASTAPNAAADSSADWLSSIDSLLAGSFLSAPAASALDFQISIDGQDLLPISGNEATASSGMGDVAIAFGDGANADATGGVGNFASAAGAGSNALTSGYGGGDFDSAVASGAGSYAEADGGNGNAAIASGDGSQSYSGGVASDPGDYNVASATGTGSLASAAYGDDNSAVANGEGSDAEAGGYLNHAGVEVADNGDSSSALGIHAVAYSGHGGDNDTAYVFDPTATVNSPGSTAEAEFGSDNYSSVFGDNSFAEAGGSRLAELGNNDIALLFGTGGYADAGSTLTAPGDFDFASIFGSGPYNAIATGGDHLYDIVSALGNEFGSAAATSGSNLLTELLALL